MPHVLVTGGAGFFGGILKRHLRSGYSEELCQVALEPVPGSVPSTPQVQSSLIPVPVEPTLK